jgi:hypothetical protein
MRAKPRHPALPQRTAVATETGAQHLVIVARDRPELYAQLTAMFADSPSVEVIVDRRQPGASARPGGDERRRLRIEEQLRTFGWSVVARAT